MIVLVSLAVNFGLSHSSIQSQSGSSTVITAPPARSAARLVYAAVPGEPPAARQAWERSCRPVGLAWLGSHLTLYKGRRVRLRATVDRVHNTKSGWYYTGFAHLRPHAYLELTESDGTHRTIVVFAGHVRHVAPGDEVVVWAVCMGRTRVNLAAGGAIRAPWVKARYMTLQ